MTSIYKSLITMGAALFFIVVFYIFSEINRGQVLVSVAEDPVASLARGFAHAEADFKDGHAHFLRFDGQYLAVPDYEITHSFKEHAEILRLFCGFGLFTNDVALRISDYEYNAVYVTAYNTRLKTLASRNPAP
ncbi:hypothetical protein R50072_33440 [Simiduia litorea]|uniref:hypothetical protein n=1 Tax=Simiduia litorea TaxID=1435348 RepID=UPI0036F30461